MSNPDRVPPCTIDQKSCPDRLATIVILNLQKILLDSDRFGVKPDEELYSLFLRVSSERSSEHLIVDAGVRLRPDCSVTPNPRLVSPNILRRQQLQLVLTHTILQAPMMVLLDPLHIFWPSCNLKRSRWAPGKIPFFGVRLPQAVGRVGRTRENPSRLGVKIEWPVH